MWDLSVNCKYVNEEVNYCLHVLSDFLKSTSRHTEAQIGHDLNGA